MQQNTEVEKMLQAKKLSGMVCGKMTSKKPVPLSGEGRTLAHSLPARSPHTTEPLFLAQETAPLNCIAGSNGLRVPSKARR